VLRRLFLAVAAATAIMSAPAAIAAPPPEVFGTLPAVQGVRLSPSGKYFAAVMNVNGVPSARVFDSDTLQQVGGVNAAKQQVIRGVRWFSDDRLVLTVVEVVEFDDSIVRDKSEASGTSFCQIMSVSRDGKNVVQIKPPGIFKDVASSCSFMGWGAEPNSMLFLASKTRTDSGVSTGGQRYVDAKPVIANLLTGETRILDELGTRGTVSWGSDRTGAIRLRYDYVAGEQILFARLQGSSDWREVHRQPSGTDSASVLTGDKSRDVQLMGFAEDLNKAYVMYWPGDRATIGLMDLRTSQITMVYGDPKYDMAGSLGVREEGIAGVSVDRDVPTQIWFDPKLKAIQANLAASFPGHLTRISSASEDLSRVAIYLEGPAAPGGAFQILDTVKNEAATISRAYPTLGLASTGDQRYITYSARDGQPIDAYLTVPRGTSGKGLPAIILPHGGPEARDSGGFDWLSQFFASRGYVVLQPQFRGSAGFGTKFAMAGRRQWGRRMQDDVTDGVKHLIANGTIDPNRVCIMGWSYGGYAALAGATLTPELYRCVIAGAGVSDIIEMQVWVRDYAGRGSRLYWRQNIGDPTADKAGIEAVSPVRNIDKVRAPILLIHGELDNVVPIKQSEIFANALKAAGKPYEFARLANENHNITFQSTRIKMLQAMDAFLAKHNPAR
jgi:dipeptidyl aminopeptidase/acylaminoacyl peptidase